MGGFCRPCDTPANDSTPGGDVSLLMYKPIIAKNYMKISGMSIVQGISMRNMTP